MPLPFPISDNDAMRLFRSSIALLGMALASLMTANAQEADRNTSAIPERSGVSEAPPITIRQQKDGPNTITEKRVRGQVTEIRVDRGANAYFLEPNRPPGSALPGDAEAPVIRAPQWRILEFDMKRPQGNRNQQNPGDAAGAPPASP